MSTPKYTIIVPTFKDHAALGRTLSNIVLQENPVRNCLREIIVAGDGHEDEAQYVTGEAKLFAAKVHHACDIKYRPTAFHHGTGNLPRASALKEATGDWIMFIDAGTALVRTAIPILNFYMEDEPERLWFNWNNIQLVDPVPLYSQALSAKLLDRSKGLAYCMPGVAICVKRELAQSVEWPNELESDWAYTSMMWDKLVEDYGEGAAEKIGYIPETLTIAYAHNRLRRYREPMTQREWDSTDLSTGWNPEKSWQKQGMVKAVQEV